MEIKKTAKDLEKEILAEEDARERRLHEKENKLMNEIDEEIEILKEIEKKDELGF
jgi:hypothetical protein